MALPATDDADDRLVALVGAWLTVPEVAERSGTDVSRIRRLLTDGELVALRISGVLHVPELFLAVATSTGDGPIALQDLKGTLTVLSDAGFRPAEAVSWLFTPDDGLREGRPIDALRAGRKSEVRRRAQAMAF
jgi:hypothetical protein